MFDALAANVMRMSNARG